MVRALLVLLARTDVRRVRLLPAVAVLVGVPLLSVVPAASPTAAQPAAPPDVEVRREWFGTGPQLSIRETVVRTSTGSRLRSRVIVDPCASRAVDPGALVPAPPPGLVPGVDGSFRARVCASGFAFTVTVVWVHVRDPGVDAPPTVSEVLADLDLTLEDVVWSPSTRQLAGLPSWFWVPSASWAPRSLTVRLGATTVTAVATPLRTRWSVDGAEVLSCEGPGVPYRPGTVPPEACTVTFTERSASVGLAMVAVWRVEITYPDGTVEVVPAFDGPPAVRELAVVDARSVTG